MRRISDWPLPLFIILIGVFSQQVSDAAHYDELMQQEDSQTTTIIE